MAALTPYQRDIVVRTIIGEAANQGAQGQIAVANVIKNRAAAGGLWPSDPAKVSLQPSQFSTWNSLKNGGNKLARNASPGSAIYQRIGKLVDGVFAGEIGDPTGGATYYYAKGTKQPGWWNKVGGTPLQIGDHLFRSKTGGPTPPGSIPNVAEDDDLVHGPRPQGNVPVLRKGKADPAWTKYAQQKIAENMPWLNLKVDGDYGPKTIAAVRVFQKAAGVKVDGLYGPQTDGAMQELYPDASESLLPGPVESSALPRLPAMGDSLVDRRDPTVYPTDTPRISPPTGALAVKTPGTSRLIDGMVAKSDPTVYPSTGMANTQARRDLASRVAGLQLAGAGSVAGPSTQAALAALPGIGGRNTMLAGGASGVETSPMDRLKQVLSTVAAGSGLSRSGGAAPIRLPTSIADVAGAGGAGSVMAAGPRIDPNQIRSFLAGGGIGAGGGAAGLGSIAPSDQYFQPGDPNGEANFANFFNAHSDPTKIDLAAAGAAGGTRTPPRLSKAGGALSAMPATNVAGFFQYLGQLFGSAQAKASDDEGSVTPSSSQILANIKASTQPYLGGSPTTLAAFAQSMARTGGDTSRVVSTGQRASATPATEYRSSNSGGGDSTSGRTGSDSGSGRVGGNSGGGNSTTTTSPSSSSSSGSRTGSDSGSSRSTSTSSGRTGTTSSVESR